MAFCFEVRVDHFPRSSVPVEGYHTAAHHTRPHREAFLKIRAARLKPFTDQGATVVLQQQSHKRLTTFFAGLRLQCGHGATKGLPLAPPQEPQRCELAAIFVAHREAPQEIVYRVERHFGEQGGAFRANATQELHRLGARITRVFALLHHRARCRLDRSLYCRSGRGRGHVKLCPLRRHRRGERGAVKLAPLCRRSRRGQRGIVGGTGAHLGQQQFSLPHALLFLWQR